MEKYGRERIVALMESKGFEVFEDGDYNLNIVALRSVEQDESGEAVLDVFNDMLVVFYKIKGVWQAFYYKCTTVPGKYYFEHPMMKDFGTAILVPGQYRGAYILGQHYGKPAMQQVGKVKLYRDKNMDDVMDLDPDTIQEVNWSGCNIHYSQTGIQNIGRWSAGCTVLNCGPESGLYKEFISHASNAIKVGFANKFTYTILLEQELLEVAV